MDILIIAPTPPFPLLTGGHIAQYYILNQLRKEHNITLILPYIKENELELLKNEWSEVNLVVPNIAVQSNSKKAPLVNRIIKRIIFASNSKRNIRYLRVNHQVLSKEILDFIKLHLIDYNYDLIQCNVLPCMNVGKVLPVNTKKIFVHQELGYICEKRTLKTFSFLTYLLLLGQYKRKRKEEINYMSNYDSVIVYSDTDKKFIKKYLPEQQVDISPFPIKIPRKESIDFKKWSELQRIVFLGGEVHYPNPDGIIWFLTKVWSNLSKQFTNLEFHIVGKWSEKFQEYCTQYDRVIFPGFVEDLPEYLRGNTMIVPLRIGSGIRTKILEAFAYQVPVVTTSIGVEGIPVQDDTHCCIADKPAVFASKIEELISSNKKKKSLTDAAYDLVKREYSIDVCVEKRKKILDQIMKSQTFA